MKNDKIILLIFLAVIAITMLVGFKFIASLREQNNALSANINQITNRIAVLELDKTMAQVSALKAKNTALKIEIDNLKSELSRISKKLPASVSRQSAQNIQRQAGSEKTAAGNKGFLIKDAKPTP